MEFLERRRALVEERLAAVVEGVDPPALQSELRHAALNGGKRVRPVVTLLCCEAAGGEVESAVDFSVGVELVHTASLVVDDIVDRSPVRRGGESAWRAFGHGPAIIASDGLLGEAFGLFSRDPEAMQIVSEAMVELGEGEATELLDHPETEAEYMELARRKTGALFRAAAEVGAVAAGADAYDVEAFGRYAERVGVAFQIRDDVLDATAGDGQLGKPAGTDAAMGRPSFVRVTGSDPATANERAREESDRALSALATVDTPDTEAREYLRELATFVVTRER